MEQQYTMLPLPPFPREAPEQRYVRVSFSQSDGNPFKIVGMYDRLNDAYQAQTQYSDAQILTTEELVALVKLWEGRRWA